MPKGKKLAERHARYIGLALEMGAAHAVAIRASEIVVDMRTYLKCMYGCKDWGHNWTCPSAPGAIKPWDFKNILKRYGSAILVHCSDKKLSQKISYELEREAFLDGHYFAFSMSDCSLCEHCAHPEAGPAGDAGAGHRRLRHGKKTESPALPAPERKRAPELVQPGAYRMKV